MITIPSTVKALFQVDGVQKNFRVHFQNGEISDITNDSVVYESVKFTESVCSQNSFKFGLSEASSIEFETVGIQNMAGMIIECGIEIDTSSLSAAQITAIESDPGDGTLVKAADSDIGYGYYRVPFGVFRVTSCPRNQQAMTHRRVQATSTASLGAELPEPEQQKLGAKGGSSTMSVNVRRLAMYLMAYNNLVTLGDNDFTKTFVADDTSFSTFTRSASFYGITISSTLKGCSLASSISDFSSQARDAIFTLDPGKYTTVYQQCLDWLENEGAVIDFRVETALRGVGAIPTLEYSQTMFGTTYISIADEELIYPPRTGMNAAFYVPASISISYGGHSTTITPAGADNAEVYVWTDDAPEALALTIVSTGGGVDVNKRKFYTFTDAYKASEFLNGFLEIHGQFAKASRNGGYEIYALDHTSPVSLGPSDCEEMWWDEYNVEPCGGIVCNYGADQTLRISFNDGLSYYEMTDNYILKHMANATESTITSLLGTHLVPALAEVGFTPVDLKSRALPWIEAGDALQVTTEDGTVVDTYALQQEISGIQDLKADIVSQGGQVIGGT